MVNCPIDPRYAIDFLESVSVVEGLTIPRLAVFIKNRARLTDELVDVLSAEFAKRKISDGFVFAEDVWPSLATLGDYHVQCLATVLFKNTLFGENAVRGAEDLWKWYGNRPKAAKRLLSITRDYFNYLPSSHYVCVCCGTECPLVCFSPAVTSWDCKNGWYVGTCQCFDCIKAKGYVAGNKILKDGIAHG